MLRGVGSERAMSWKLPEKKAGPKRESSLVCKKKGVMLCSNLSAPRERRQRVSHQDEQNDRESV